MERPSRLPKTDEFARFWQNFDPLNCYTYSEKEFFRHLFSVIRTSRLRNATAPVWANPCLCLTRHGLTRIE